MAIKTYNIRIDGEQGFTTFWLTLLRETRDAYNLCSDIITTEKVKIGLTAIHNACYDKLRNNFPSLPSQAVIRVQKEVLQAFKSKKTNKHKGSAPHKTSLSLTLDKRLYSNFTAEGISLTSGKSNCRERFTFKPYPKIAEMFATSVAKDPTIFYKDSSLWLPNAQNPLRFSASPRIFSSWVVDRTLKLFLILKLFKQSFHLALPRGHQAS